LSVSNITWIEWVDYRDLIRHIGRSHVVLGIFGTTAKCQHVIPNKVFQVVMAGRPIVTADTPAIRELLDESQYVSFVPAGDPSSLANAVIEIERPPSVSELHRSQPRFREIFPGYIGARLKNLMRNQLN
jgi:glycosyltransferase involved in cell wall biosynthesis